MRRVIAIATSLAAAAILVVASGASGRATETVDVGDDFFAPKKLKIEKNDRVAFNWIGENEHDVALGDGPGKFFNSGPTDEPGVNFKKKFKKTGKYTLICTLHSEMTMNLKVKK
jgi:plastocyanin